MSEQTTDPPKYLTASPVGDVILCIFSTVVGVVVNCKFLHVMKADDVRNRQRGQRNGLLVKDVMTTNTILKMVLYPPVLFAKLYVDINLPLPEWSYHLFCYQRLLMGFIRIYIAFSSLVVAMMRFIFIVHHDMVTSWGAQKMKKIFYYSSILIPLTLALLLDSSFSVELSQKPPGHFVCLKSYEVAHNNATTEHSIDVTSFQSPLHSFAILHVPLSIMDAVSIVGRIMMAIIFTNLVEAVLYWKIFAQIKRYVYFKTFTYHQN